MAAAFMATSLLLTIISPYGDSGAPSGTAIFHEEPVAAPAAGTAPETALPATASPVGGELSGTIGGELTIPTSPAVAPSESAVETESEPQPAEQP
jgi:hypothetical protein